MPTPLVAKPMPARAARAVTSKPRCAECDSLGDRRVRYDARPDTFVPIDLRAMTTTFLTRGSR